MRSAIHPREAARYRFISNYQGCSDYRVTGVEGRVHVRLLSQRGQAIYSEPIDAQLLGTVVAGLDPVSEEVLTHFQRKIDALRLEMRELKNLWVERLVPARWYPGYGWVRCEPAGGNAQAA
jgi:hypothetical protein